MSVPRGLTGDVRSDWTELLRSTEPRDAFDPAALEGLPEPVQRWLTHAIAPGTLLSERVALRMHGRIRLGSWRPFRATQHMAVQGGFVWAATASLMGLPIVGFDRYTRGSGEMRWKLLGALSVMSGSGSDVTRSAAGRHASELLLALPSAALSKAIVWEEVDGDRATAHVPTPAGAHPVTLAVAESGALTEVAMSRWGNPGKEPFGEYPFGAVLRDEVTFGGFTIPRTASAGWFYGTDRWDEGSFITSTVDDATYA